MAHNVNIMLQIGVVQHFFHIETPKIF